MTDMQVDQDAHLAWVDHMLAEAREIARARAAGAPLLADTTWAA